MRTQTLFSKLLLHISSQKTQAKMSISLKTDDKSILSVLLYQFLSEKSAYSSFKEFNKVVKDNFISRDDFKFWFDRFSSGKLDEEEDDLSISDLKSILSDDKHRLRACIFFETLKEKRSIEKSNDKKVTDAYNRLSKVIDIDFSEFSSWFNRFIGGNLKLKDCKFSDLPLEIVEQVVENLDYFGRSAFRKVSKIMRSIVDDAKVNVDFLRIKIAETSTAIGFDSIRPIRYYQLFGRCYMSRGFGEKELKDQNHWELAVNELKIILNHKKFTIDTLKIQFACFSHFNRFGRILKSLDDKLHVRHLFLSSDLVHPLENILPFLKPEILETISVNSYFFCADLMKRLMGMDQWKNARNLEIYGILCNFGSTENVLHFENITLHVLTMVNNEELAQIKKILLESSQIETFCIDVSIRGKIDWNVIEGGLGPIIPGIDGIRRLVSRNKQQFYEIEEEEKSVKFVRKTYY
ncbi:hypothetical protein L3Y34_009552 [Caenorhabditis briggsae]|uniref:F-box domain-containing protein n=3 Tax=Caenorhabditis briggsae TaxID=6238 RepID=A0AAE9A641_CAEBR|nr:hypothetical protein L3Y34_009552 [Caenorhabditis briggsae]